MQPTWDDQREWLETDGLGGFASGTVGGIRTRRYHALLLVTNRRFSSATARRPCCDVVARDQ
ncbi:MAG TPA: glycogen debranching enzyme N-terminal domain-containing protein [Tepidisphaeraceae bacterium]|nr:glycogen debranching enzyme N-terminal domain-containing protein [Tepidisphaeraceae bacterium]